MQKATFSTPTNFCSIKSLNQDSENSVLALLSGPLSLLQYDLFPESKPVSKSAKLPVEGYDVTHSAPSGNMTRLNFDMDVYQSDLAQAVVNNTIPCRKDMLDFSCSGKGPYGTSSVHYEKRHSSNTQTCQKFPLRADDRGGHVPSVSFNGCPRVYCLKTSGILLLSNTGVLGIVCSCHYSHMSVSMFCKHSGLSDSNPGDVVLMDNGQTVAQWRQLYFQKFGILLPEDQLGWDWPEELSGTTGLANSSFFMPKCSSTSLCQLADSYGCLMGPGKHSVSVASSIDQRFANNFVIDGLQNKLRRSIQGRNNHFSEGLPYCLDQNQHVAQENEIFERQRSRCFSASTSLARKPDNESQSPCSVGSIRKIAIAANEFCSFQNSRNLTEDLGTKFSGMKTANDCVLVDRDPAASKVELGFGQPHKQHQPSRNSSQSFMGLGCLGSLNNRSKTFHEKMVHYSATASKREDFRISLKNDMNSLSACARRERPVNRGNLAYSMNRAGHSHIKNGEHDTEKSSDISLFHQANNIIENGLYKDSNDNMKGCEVVKPMLWHSISDTAKGDSVDVHPFSHYGPRVPMDNYGLDFQKTVDKDNVAKCLSDSTCHPTESRLTVQQKEENIASFSGFTVANSAKRNHFSDEFLDEPQDASFNRESNSLREKFFSHGSVHNGDNFLKPIISPAYLSLISPLQASSLGFHLDPDMNPNLSKQEGIDMTSCLLDDNMRLLALRQIIELSQKQQAILGLMSHANKGYSGSSSFQMQNTLVDPLKVAREKEGTQSSCRQNDFEVATTSLPVVATSRMFSVSPEAGQNYSCDVSMAPATLFSLEATMRRQIPQGPFQHKQSSPRLNQSERIFPAPTVVERCCPILGSICSPSMSIGASQIKYPRGSFEFQADRTSKEWTERSGSQPHMFVAVESVKDNALLEKHHVAIDQSVDLSGNILDSNVNLSIQCSDGPSDVEGKANTMCMDHVGHLVGRRGNELQLDRAAICFDRADGAVDSLKEHERSIISSGCSVPAVTQASITVNNDTTSAVDAQHVECANQLVVDEGSGVDRCCLPDYPFKCKGSAEFHCNCPQANAERELPSEVTSNCSSNSLLGELKFMGSLTWNKRRNRIHHNLPVRKRSKYLHKPKTMLKIRKRQRLMKLSELGSSFSTAGHTRKSISTGYEDHGSCSFEDKDMFLHSGHRTSCSSDNCFCRTNFRCYESPLGPSKLSTRKRNMMRIYSDEEVRNKQLRGHINYGKDPLARCVKKFREKSASDASGPPKLNVTCYENAEKLTEHKSIGFRKAAPLQVNADRVMAKPMVYGPYGEIRKGNFDLYVSKPAKIISLSRILEKAKQCKAPAICGHMLTCTSELNEAAYGGSDASSNEISNLVQNKDSKNPDIRSCRLSQCSAAKSSIIACLEEEGKLCAGKYRKNSAVGTHTQVESKFGRMRERTCSLNELSLPDRFCSGKRSFTLEIDCLLRVLWWIPSQMSSTYLIKRMHATLITLKRKSYSPCVFVWSMVSALFASPYECPKVNERTFASVKEHLLILHQDMSRQLAAAFLNSENDECLIMERLSSLRSLLQNKNEGSNANSINKFKSNSRGASHSSKKFSLKNSRTVKTKRLSKILKDTEIERLPAHGINDVTTIKCYAEPDRLANTFCCICRRLKEDRANCSLKGRQCLVQDSLQSEAEGVNDENFRFYGRCTHHDKDVDCGPSTITVSDIICSGDILRCARTEGYKKRKWDNVLANLNGPYQGKCGSFVPQDQINAWTHIHGQKKCSQAILQLPHSVAESDCRKEYGCYKQAKGWKRLVVYKSGIHALGLYASQFICRGEMVVEYVGEIVGLRIADKREREYQSGRRIQCKSACYFFRIDKEHIIDATRKGGIARFVNHSCLPNCFAKVISVRDEKKVVFFAHRDILPGEEITYDYHFNYEDEGKKIPCYCKSKNGRLYLN